MEENNGLWVVEFGSSIGLIGRGIFVLNGERILGGDLGYYYTGYCTQDKNNINGEIDIVRFDQNTVSVFGDIDSYVLTFDGTITNSLLTAKGKSDSFPNIEMEINAQKKEDL